jgi:hypothetical protein
MRLLHANKADTLPAFAFNCGTHTTHVAYRSHILISLTKRTLTLNITVVRYYRQKIDGNGVLVLSTG